MERKVLPSAGSLSKLSKLLELGNFIAGTFSLFGVPHVGVGTQALGIYSITFPGMLAESGSEVEHPRLKSAVIWMPSP